MSWFRETYLARVFQHHKWLGAAVISYCILSLTFTAMGDEVTPFFVWGMFSQKEKVKSQYLVPRLMIDGEELIYSRQLWDPNRHLIRSSVNYYQAMLANNSQDPSRTFFAAKLGSRYHLIEGFQQSITNDSTQFDAYQQWLRRYLRRSLNEPVNQLEVYLDSYEYQPGGTVQKTNTQLLFTE